jgi:hypothetical protein
MREYLPSIVAAIAMALATPATSAGVEHPATVKIA